MPYYSGDYYVGDYYEGDPFLGGLFRGLSKVVGFGRKVVQAVRTPPTVGGAIVNIGSPAAAGMASRMGQLGRAGGAIVRRAGGVISKHPVLTAAGAAGTIGILGGRVSGPEAAAMGAPRGFHISARTGRVVKNRRMRVTNPRALRRAIRRATGFARLAKRVLRFTSPRPPRGRGYFKTKRRRKM